MNLAALRSPIFRKYAAANFVALNGIWIQRVTMGWLAWNLTGSAQFVGLIAALNFLPAVVSGPVFGVLADRVDLRRAALDTQGMTATMAALMYCLYMGGLLIPAVLAVVALGLGMITSAQAPIRMALAPRLAPRAAISSVIVITSLNFNLTRLTGPAIGGLVIARYGIDAALLMMILTPIPLILTLIWLHLLPSDDLPSPRQSFGAELRTGIVYAAQNPQVRFALVLTGVSAIIGRGVLEILPALADGRFERGAAGLGQLTAAAGAGALISGLFQIVIHAGDATAAARRSLIATLGAAVLVVVLGVQSQWWVAVLGVAGLGFCGTLVGVSLQSGIQMILPDGYRGRVMSLWALVAMGATATGAFVQGALADWLGLSVTLIGVGALGIFTVALIQFARHVSLRQ